MLNLLILCGLLGAVLGMRFTVHILIPVLGFALAITAFIGAALSYSVWSIVQEMVLAVCFIQLGYISGSASRFVIAAARTTRDGNGEVKFSIRDQAVDNF